MSDNDFAQFIIVWCVILLSFAFLFRIVDKYHDRKMEKMRIDKIKAQIDLALKDEPQNEGER